MTVKTEIYFATRKTSSAHVYITKGAGKVRINNVPIEMIPQEHARETILAPLEIAGDLRDKIDVSVRVRGGGFMGQAGAAATAISRALTGWTKSKKEPKDHPLPKSTREDLRKRISDFDKYLISGDARRKEPKKFGGTRRSKKKAKVIPLDREGCYLSRRQGNKRQAIYGLLSKGDDSRKWNPPDSTHSGLSGLALVCQGDHNSSRL